MAYKAYRKLGTDRTCTYNGSRYLFPDSRPGDFVLFIHGKPESGTARRLRFDELVALDDSKSPKK